ncbi:MAG: FAD:protein FMN transferase, partial [Chloroflexi bacterium]
MNGVIRSSRPAPSPSTSSRLPSVRSRIARCWRLPSGARSVRRVASVLGIADDRALGCVMRLVVTRPSGLMAAKVAVDEILCAIDAAASRFRADSELSRLNADTGREVAVSPLLAQAVAAAMRGARLTGGAVDPTVGLALRLAGYDSDFAAVPGDGGPIRLIATQVPGWMAVEFDHLSRTVKVPRGVELDLG